MRLELSQLSESITITGEPPLLETETSPRASTIENRAQFDTPQKFSLIVTTAVPFGRGKRFGNSVHPVLNAILGGWNLNTEYNTQMGFPFDFPNAAPLAAKSAQLSDDMSPIPTSGC